MGFEDSDSWHWTLALLNLVTLLDSVTHGFWTLTLWTLSLQTPAPHGYPPNPSLSRKGVGPSF